MVGMSTVPALIMSATANSASTRAIPSPKPRG